MIDLQEHTVGETLFEGPGYAMREGRRKADGAPVAIKVLLGEHPSPAQIARLRHEHAVLSDLDLLGVPRALALERTASGPALVLEPLRGRPLRERLRDGPLDLRTALAIGASIAGAVESLHRHRVVHKDLTPDGILVEPILLEVQLIDLGFAARLAQETPRPEGPAALEGTLAYMSPEQTGRMNRVVDSRSDLYALGVIVFEMLTGVLPFREEDPLELVHSHVARTPPRPSEVALGVPETVSDVVMKLLAKAAEDRYQSASGAQADLQECLARLDRAWEIAPFPLGRRDLPSDLRVPQRLYGREAELEALQAAFVRAGLGAPELVLVKGYAGVGKSALVREVHRSIARGGGYFGGGKADQVGQGIPYAPMSHALREILRQILSESEASLARWRERLEAALGQDLRLLFDLVPELELCVGPRSPPPPLGPAESKQRFRLAFLAFLRALASERPLLVFIDDLQWVDPASLALLELLLTDPESGRLLVVGAYRDDEVDGVHPLARAAPAPRGAGAAISEITLGPLSLESVTALLRDTLSAQGSPVASLAALVFEKTHGNPFFVSRFLHAIHRDGALYLDPATGAWAWDLDRISAAASTDNVVEFMARKIGELAPGTRRALELAACIGHEFELETLATIAETTPAGASSDLWEALTEGLVVPLDPDYRFAGEPGASGRVAYRFLHDRVQQAAYSLIEEGRRREVHLRIGRLLAAASGGEPEDEALLEVVHQKGLGAALITDPAERSALARWGLLAGRRTKAATAYEAAQGFLDSAAALLEGSGAEADDPTLYAIDVERAECDYLSGNFATAEARYQTLLPRTATDLERAALHAARVALHQTQGCFADAIAAGRDGLRLLGVELPATEDALKAALGAELAAVSANLAGRRVEALVDAPELVDPSERAILRLLTEVWTPAHFSDPALRNVITIKHVNFSLKHGHSDVSSFGYAVYCTVLARVLQRYEDARAFGRLSLALNERFQNAYLTCKLHLLFGSSAHFFEPLRAVPPYLERAYEAGLAFGDPSYASYAAAILPPLWMNLGKELDVILARVESFLAVALRRTRDELALVFLQFGKQVLLNLMGRTKDRRTLNDAAFDERDFMRSLLRPGFEYAACWYFILRLELAFLYGDPAGAMARAADAEARLESARGTYLVTELSFFAALALAELLPGAEGGDAARLRAELDRHEQQMAFWAEQCPVNYRGKHLLLLAERARLEGRGDEATALYDEAIDSAREAEFLRDEAVASELAGRFYLGKGRRRIARAYLSDAHHAYLRWGATAKAAQLEERHPDLLGQAEAPRRSVAPGPARADALDVMSVVRAGQAISSEIVLDRVLDRLLRITLSSAGAGRGVLLLERDGRLRLEATITVQPDEVRKGSGIALEEAGGELPVSIAQYVERTREPVVLGDAAEEPRFSGDPYIERARPRSVLCLSLVHHGRLTGLLYLENAAVADAFTPARLEVCRLLASQAAIAVENALLYGRVHAVSEQLRRANEHLEAEVELRMEDLRVELLERARSDEARANLQEEIIRVQRDRLTELSTPLIPISPEVVVMPLIGAIDEDRAAQILEAALSGVSARGAAVLIIDITGVQRVDAAVAASLVRTASALRLLGAQAVLTGIRAEVAQTLVELGADLAGIETRGTLEGGIAYAMSRARRSRAAAPGPARPR